jgi:hypothetical protein
LGCGDDHFAKWKGNRRIPASEDYETSPAKPASGAPHENRAPASLFKAIIRLFVRASAGANGIRNAPVAEVPRPFLKSNRNPLAYETPSTPHADRTRRRHNICRLRQKNRRPTGTAAG